MPLEVLEGSEGGSQRYQGKAQVVWSGAGNSLCSLLSCAGKLTGGGNPGGNDCRVVFVSFMTNPSRTGERDSG